MKAMAKIALAILIAIAIATPALAADKLITAKVESVTVAKDKNQQEYVRLRVAAAKELNGIQYTSAVPAMVFGPEVAKAKTIKSGQTVKMIVQEREYQGRTSYTVLKIAE